MIILFYLINTLIYLVLIAGMLANLKDCNKKDAYYITAYCIIIVLNWMLMFVVTT
jgi:hypothetical protein